MAITGPTGSGKSALAVELALRFGGEVISCDAMQVYRGFDIGMAKLPPAARRGVPHHLIDICEPQETFSAGDFARVAGAVAGEIVRRNRIPIVAGGTGFYLRALVEGLFEGPERDTALRESLKERERRRPGVIHRLLRRFDPDSAGRIHPNDLNKTIRAVEVGIASRSTLTDLHRTPRKPPANFDATIVFLDPDRAALYDRINQRCREMFEEGLVEETRRNLAMGIPRSAQPFQGVGYREALAVLDNEITVEQAVRLSQQATRRYAKRQWTWFRREGRAIRIPGFGDEPAALRRALEIVGEIPKLRGEIPAE